MTKYPFTINPIILSEEQFEETIEANKCLQSKRERTMVMGFNDPNDYDFKFKIRREECDEPVYNCPSDDPNNGYDIIYCHKSLIEENSKYLKQMIANMKSNKESNEMRIKGYSYKTFFHFIQYLYTDSIETEDIELLNDLLLLSDKLSEKELKTRCVSKIKLLLDVENVCQFYSSAITNRSSELEEYCFEFMTQNIKSIVNTEGYDELDAKIVKSFFKKHFKEQK